MRRVKHGVDGWVLAGLAAAVLLWSAASAEPIFEMVPGFPTDDWSAGRPYLPPLVSFDGLSEAQRADLEKVTRHFREDRGFTKDVAYGSLDDLEKAFARFGIEEQGDAVVGTPIVARGAKDPPKGALDFHRDYMPFVLKLHTAWCKEKSDEARKRIARMHTLLCRDMLAMGWREGATGYGHMGNGYDVRHWAPAMVNMNCLLPEDMRDGVMKTVAWVMLAGKVIEERPEVSTDMIHNYTVSILDATAELSDPAERFQRFMCFKRFLDIIITNEFPFAPDGTIHHHWGHHLAYGGYSPPSLVIGQVFPLHRTVFAIRPEAHERLRVYTRAIDYQSVGRLAPPNLFLRAGIPVRCNPAAVAGRLALMGTPDGSKEIDPEMAGIYLRASDKTDDPIAETLRKAGFEASPPPSGHLTLNYAAASIHRRGNWMVAAVGMFKGRRGLEIYGWADRNNYGRYARNGSVWPVVGEDMGYRFEGWDWRYWPGATSLLRPGYELFEGYRTGIGNPTETAGGADLDGNGVWGMDFVGMDVHFKKSAFFFGNRVTVVTTGIRKADLHPKQAPYAVVTTLFQQEIMPDDAGKRAPIGWQGETVDAFPWEASAPAVDGAVLADVLGNPVVVWPGSQGALRVRRRPQSWVFMRKPFLKSPDANPIINIKKRQFREKPIRANEGYFKPLEGDFALGYIDHGEVPNGAECVYTIFMQGKPEGAKNLACALQSGKDAPIRIVQKDERAHVLCERATGSWGLAIFEDGAALDAASPVVSASHPCFVMIASHGAKKRIVVGVGGVGDPVGVTLNLRGSAKPITVRVPRPLLGHATVEWRTP